MLFISGAGFKGRGFFARKKIEKGSFVACYWGQRITKNEYEKLKEDERNAYCFTELKSLFIDSGDESKSGWARYMNDNHVSPNVAPIIVNSVSHIAFQALRILSLLKSWNTTMDAPWRQTRSEPKKQPRSKIELIELTPMQAENQVSVQPLTDITSTKKLGTTETHSSEKNELS